MRATTVSTPRTCLLLFGSLRQKLQLLDSLGAQTGSMSSRRRLRVRAHISAPERAEKAVEGPWCATSTQPSISSHFDSRSQLAEVLELPRASCPLNKTRPAPNSVAWLDSPHPPPCPLASRHMAKMISRPVPAAAAAPALGRLPPTCCADAESSCCEACQAANGGKLNSESQASNTAPAGLPHPRLTCIPPRPDSIIRQASLASAHPYFGVSNFYV